MRPHVLVSSFVAALLAAGSLALRPPVPPTLECVGVVSEDVTVMSRAADGIGIAITVHRPDCATARHPVPVILHSHGWAGTRSSDPAAFTRELAAGFAVVSVDQRGHGASGGEANVQDPALEAQDVLAVIDHVAAYDWVLLEPGRRTFGRDPVLLGAGGSYGGAFQTVTALTEIEETGATRFDALAPEITWYDLPQSLAPNDVPRSAWNTALYAAGMAQARPAPFLSEAFAYSVTTGQWADGTILGEPDPTGATPDIDARLATHAPRAFVERGVQLDVPVIWRQGITDTLFNLNQGLANFRHTLTDDARSRSLFVGHNGGHTLPTLYPTVRPDAPGTTDDHCSDEVAEGGWGELRLAFFRAVVDGAADPSAEVMAAHDGLRRINLMTDRGDACLRLDSLPEPVTGTAGVDAVAVDDAWLTTTGVGAGTFVELDLPSGSYAGVPTLTGTVTSLGVDQRILFGIARGTSPADATVIQSGLTPLRVVQPEQVGAPFALELAGIAVDLDDDERLFLALTPLSEQYYAHGSQRTPGWLGFTDLAVSLPRVDGH